MATDIVKQTIAQLQSSGTAYLNTPSARFHCSGVLPYCVYNNAVFFILGKTRNGKLLTYTGKSEADRDHAGFFEAPVVTAAREFTEESLGAIISYEQCLDACRSCDASRIIVSSTPKQTLCFTFLIEVPYRRHYSACFYKTRAFLDYIGARDHYLNEFCELKAVCFETMNNKIRYAWRSAGMVTLDSEWAKVQALEPPVDAGAVTIAPGAGTGTAQLLHADDDEDGLPALSLFPAPRFRFSPAFHPFKNGGEARSYAHVARPPGLDDWRARITNIERPQATTQRLLENDESMS